MQERILPRHFISMEEDIVLVCRKSNISMQEGREVEGKSVMRIKNNIHNYSGAMSSPQYGEFYFGQLHPQLVGRLVGRLCFQSVGYLTFILKRFSLILNSAKKKS